MASTPMIGVESGQDVARAVLADGDDVQAMVHRSEPAGPGRLAALLEDLARAAPAARAARGVAIATDFFESALERRSGLAKVGCVRLAGSDEDVVPPLFGWPGELVAVVDGGHAVLIGGCDYDGVPIDPTASTDQLLAVGERLRSRGAQAFAVTAVFAPVDPSAETRAGALLDASFPGVPVALSHSLGSIGLIERENTTVLNAALRPLAAAATRALEHEVGTVLPGVPAYLTRVDGTVMELPFVSRFPVLTLGAVGAARLRGAARLASYAECLVAEMADGRRWAAVIRAGEPARSPRGAVVAGVPTALPGIERVAVGDGEHGWALAARSTGREALPWVAAHRAPGLPIDPVARTEGAAALGAAGTLIAGIVDRIVPGGPSRQVGLIEQARQMASQQALLAGAREESIDVVEVEEIPLAYVPGDLVRLRVRAVGELPWSQAVPGAEARDVQHAHQ